MAAPKTLVFPNNFAAVFRNSGAAPVNVPCLGKTGTIFKPGETIAVIGNPFETPSTPQRWDAKKKITDLASFTTGSTPAIETLGLPSDTFIVDEVDGQNAELIGTTPNQMAVPTDADLCFYEEDGAGGFKLKAGFRIIPL